MKLEWIPDQSHIKDMWKIGENSKERNYYKQEVVWHGILDSSKNYSPWYHVDVNKGMKQR